MKLGRESSSVFGAISSIVMLFLLKEMLSIEGVDVNVMCIRHKEFTIIELWCKIEENKKQQAKQTSLIAQTINYCK